MFKLGGAQAIAAMAYGTATVPKVDKIFGPGNSWVTAAKQIVAQDADGAALDMPAGPSEVLVIADEYARPEFVAADLLAQAEHSADAQVVLVTTSRALAEACIAAGRGGRCARCRARAIAGGDRREPRHRRRRPRRRRMDVSNRYAPEHLILQVDESARTCCRRCAMPGPCSSAPGRPKPWATTAAAPTTCCRRTATRAPTAASALPDFVKRITVQELTPDGLRDLGLTARTLARLESLDAHANAVHGAPRCACAGGDA